MFPLFSQTMYRSVVPEEVVVPHVSSLSDLMSTQNSSAVAMSMSDGRHNMYERKRPYFRRRYSLRAAASDSAAFIIFFFHGVRIISRTVPNALFFFSRFKKNTWGAVARERMPEFPKMIRRWTTLGWSKRNRPNPTKTAANAGGNVPFA